ncbi:hypothetical protein RvY_19115 [Ramazzottius varieornatus]|uniref:Uncharacterized protein n=1 Tax=Ramazzottius varieornatus TaxID=947166 RepID=A0A1D1W8C1_RAMVA|nr:hypothetical protein RvY_19115 [Ramazzottius varieornatus]
MTNGDYDALKAYRTLLVMTAAKDDPKDLRHFELQEEFKRRSALDFNFTYPADEKVHDDDKAE